MGVFLYGLKSKENEECVVCSSIYTQMYIKETIEIGEAIALTKFFFLSHFYSYFSSLPAKKTKPVSQRQKLPDKKRIKF